MTTLPIPASSSSLVSKADGLDLARRYASLAVSENTKRAYQAAARAFIAWGGNLPATESDILSYLGAHAGVLKPDTLSLHLTAIRKWHSEARFTDPTRTHSVEATLAGIRRAHGKPKKKARPLLVEDLEIIVTHLKSDDSLRAKRDSALLQIGFFGAFRRQELVGIAVEDIAWLKPKGVQILLRSSKTDQEGRGITRDIPSGDETLCPVRALEAWLDAAGIKEGPVFRGLSTRGALARKGLNPASVVDLLANAATAAGIPGALEMSGHSLRRGLATSARQHGADLLEIKRQGGWRDDRTVQGYIDEAEQFTNTASSRLLNRRRAK